MANIKTIENKIKANVTSVGGAINANIAKGDNTIKGNASGVPSATTERKGIIRIATEEEALAGVLNNVAITPHTLELKTTTFVFEQAIASDTWVINHTLNKRPSIIVVDTLDRVQVPDDIYYNSDNKMTVTFLAAFAGKAYLN